MKKETFKSLVCICLSLVIIGSALVAGINIAMVTHGDARTLTPSEATELEDVDCILVLGCLVKHDGTPSDMLADRLTTAIDLYFSSASRKLLMSGDHGQKEYNEVGTMKAFATTAGVPSENIFMDHAGFSTYESIYRAKEIFGADKIIIVTQSYHLKRALYIATALGIEAYGVSADIRDYSGQIVRDAREVLARVKDFALALIKPKPTYLGEVIPVSGNGDITNDREGA